MNLKKKKYFFLFCTKKLKLNTLLKKKVTNCYISRKRILIQNIFVEPFFQLFWTAKMLHTILLNLFSISFRSKLFFHNTISLLALATWRSCYLKYRFNLVKSYCSKLTYVFLCPPLVLGYQCSSLWLLFTVFDCT